MQHRVPLGKMAANDLHTVITYLLKLYHHHDDIVLAHVFHFIVKKHIDKVGHENNLPDKGTKQSVIICIVDPYSERNLADNIAKTVETRTTLPNN